MKRNAIILFFLLGVEWLCYGQWSTDLRQNTRVTSNGHTCFAAIPDDTGGALVVWGETKAGGATMYAQKYRSDGTIAIAKKRLFSHSGSSSCEDNSFTSVQLLRHENSDNVYITFTILLKGTIMSSGTHTQYLQYQIISLSDASTKVRNQNNEDKGYNLGYNYGNDIDLHVRAKFIDSNGKVLVSWQQKNNPNDNNRGGGGSTSNGTDIRLAIIDVSNLDGPLVYFRYELIGNQTKPNFYAIADRIYLAYRNEVTTLNFRKFTINSNNTISSVGETIRLGSISDNGLPITDVQTKLDDSGELTVYAIGDAPNLKGNLLGYRVNLSTSTTNQPLTVVSSFDYSNIETAHGFSTNSTFFFTRNNRQNIQRFEGTALRSAETPIVQINSSGAATHSGSKISDGPEKYAVIGKNGGNDATELHGQVIRFDNNNSLGVREWGDNGKLVSNALGNKSSMSCFSLTNGNIFFIWKDERNGTNCNADVYCQVLDKDGNLPIKFEIKNVRLSKKKFCNDEINVGSNNTLKVSFDATPTPGVYSWSFLGVFLRLANLSTINDQSVGYNGGNSSEITVTLRPTTPTIQWAYIVYVGTFAVPSSGGKLFFSEPSVDTLVLAPPSPKPTIMPITICTGERPMLTANGSNLLWYDSASGGTGSPTPPSSAVTQSRSYYVTQNTNGCESLREEVKVNVITSPTIAATANGSKSLQQCESNASLTLSASPSTGFSNIQWTGPNGYSSTQANPVALTGTAVRSGVYRVRGSSMCGSATDSVTVRIDPSLRNFRITPDPATLCNRTEGIELSAVIDSSAGVIYQWSGGLSGADQAKYKVFQPSTYSVRISRGSCSDTKSVTVKEQLLSVSVKSPVVSNPILVCSGSNSIPIQLTATANPNNSTITWKRNNGENAPPPNTGVNYTPSQSGQYYAEVSANGCTSQQSPEKITIEALSTFTVSLTPNNTPPTCEGTPILLAAVPSESRFIAQYEYEWMQDGTVIKKGGNTYAASTSGSYVVNLTKDGCKATSIANQISFKPSRVTIAALDHNTLESSKSSDNQYQWFFKKGMPMSLSDTINYTPYKQNNMNVVSQNVFGAEHSTTYLVRANRDGCGLKFSQPYYVGVFTSLQNSINGNEYWLVYPNPAVESIVVENQAKPSAPVEVRFWDSWGRELQHFSQDRIQERYSVGHLPAGVYYVEIKENGKVITKKIVKQ